MIVLLSIKQKKALQHAVGLFFDLKITLLQFVKFNSSNTLVVLNFNKINTAGN